MECVDCKKLTLTKININGDIIGKFGLFEIEQTFINNRNKVLEVYYTFPITETATVIDFEVKIGDKLLKGKCKEKNKAKKEYIENVVKGNSSYLLEEKTKNIFTISIGKIDKKEEVKIKIKYIDKFDITDNKINVFIPTLIVPRYKSKITSMLIYGDVDYTVDFNINISQNLNLKSINCLTHNIQIKDNKIKATNYDLSKDFKLEVELKNELSSNALISTNKDGSKTLYLSFLPEITDKYQDNEFEYIFIVDISGSMFGDNIEQTKTALKKCLLQLDLGDKFNIIPFESSFKAMEINSVEFNEITLSKAIKYIDNLNADGGTEILNPIKFALYENNTNKTILLFTDGQVDNEREIINYVENNIGNNRIFAFGIDNNVNAYFIKELSKAGNGKAELIQPNERIDNKIFRTFERIQTPLLEDLKVNYGRNEVLDEIREENTLFNYEFFNLFCEIEDLVDDITLSGRISNKEYSWKIKKEDIIHTDLNLETLFAKQAIDRLEEYIQKTNDEEKQKCYRDMIVELSETYNINSKYTSFISVYEREEKLFELPEYEQITLSKAGIKDKFSRCIDMLSVGFYGDETVYEDCRHCYGDIDASFNNDKILSIPDFLEARETPNEITNRELLKASTTKYYKEFINTKEKDIITYILFALYYQKNKNIELNYIELINFLKNKKDEIIKNEKIQNLICLLYWILEHNNIESSKELIDLMTENTKKIAYSKMKIKFNFKRLNSEKIKEIIEHQTTKENINAILEDFLKEYYY